MSDSPTFTRFLAQLRAEGREKADGFDPSHFDGLAPEERPRVFALLVGALDTGDTTAARGLLLLDASAGARALQDALPRHPFPDPVGLSIATELWAHDRWPDAGATLVRYTAHPSAQARLQSLFQLQGAPCTATLGAAMRARVVEDADPTNRSYAAKKLLACLGLASSPEHAYAEHRAVMMRLRSDSRAEREAALAELPSAGSRSGGP